MMSILNGLGIAVFPLAEFVSGQLFKVSKSILDANSYFLRLEMLLKQAGGYYAVYGTSLGFTILGLIYVYFIPESVVSRNITFDDEKHTWCQKFTGSMVGSYR